MALSGYRLMWMMVLFDLPVVTEKERKAATRFRKFLLDEGYEMAQLSVYTRFTSGKEQVEAYTRRIESHLPPSGKVHVLCFTDKQYETMKCFRGRTAEPRRKNPEQYVLF
jgi:CRISPR-associated protein Cas2